MNHWKFANCKWWWSCSLVQTKSGLTWEFGLVKFVSLFFFTCSLRHDIEWTGSHRKHYIIRQTKEAHWYRVFHETQSDAGRYLWQQVVWGLLWRRKFNIYRKCGSCTCLRTKQIRKLAPQIRTKLFYILI